MSSNKFIITGIFSLAMFFVASQAFASQAIINPRILIVPGHEPEYGGAEFGKIKERELVVELAGYLEEFLEADGAYKVFKTRDEESWTRIFRDYFKNNEAAILAWRKKAMQEASHSISSPLIHNDVETDVGMRLYGITKWANENNIDLMVHVHVNDDPVHSRKVPGKFSGFSIYIPPEQYSNGKISQAIADALFKRLSRYNPVSDLKSESAGILHSPDLIALGANDTAKSPSILIEYDYIYSPQITNLTTRSIALKDFAYQTYLALQDFFGRNITIPSGSHDSSVLPYVWLGPVMERSSESDVYALQTALMALGEYPPKGKTKNDCPRSGVFGACTKAALKTFQHNHKITDESGVAGAQTIEALHDNF